MGVLIGAPSYRQQQSRLVDRDGAIDVEPIDMTTDPDEGRRQIEAMQPPALKVGDLVRLKAGGEHVFTVVAIEDYGNNAVCEWQEHEGALAQARRDTFPAHTLVRISDEREQVAEGPQDTGQRAQEGDAQ